MPIPGRRFEAEMTFRREMPLHGADQADKQEGRAINHMEAMEAGRQEEGRGINATAIKLERRHAILPRLQGGEDHAEQHCDGQAPDEPLAVILQQRMVRPGDGAARQQQDHGIQEGQIEGIKGERALGRPHRHFSARNMHREQREMEIGPEEGHKEHDFGGDEQRHAVAQANAHDRRMQPRRAAFLHHIAPPEEHGCKKTGEAQEKDTAIAVMRPKDNAQHQRATGKGPHQRPG